MQCKQKIFGDHIFVNYKYQPFEDNNKWILHVEKEDAIQRNYLVPLYRQDQLQDMWIKIVNQGWIDNGKEAYAIEDHYSCLNSFIEWYEKENKNPLNYTSNEQLWLVFVMQEIHNKKWNDKTEDWEDRVDSK